MSYATPQHLVERHDVDVIGDLATDNRTRLSKIDILASTNVQTALTDASGNVEVALLQGGQYTPEQLQKIIDNENSPAPNNTKNQAGHLRRIVCWLAMAVLFERRPGIHADLADKYLERGDRYLMDIANGKNVFGIPDEKHVDAGTPSVGGPTALQYDDLNLLPERMPRFFPGSETRIPKSRG